MLNSRFYLIARQTFRDLLRERILYNVFFVAVFLIFLGYLAARLVFGHQERVMLDFGIVVIALSIFVVSASAGARLIRTEIESRNIFLTLVRPIPRPTYS